MTLERKLIANYKKWTVTKAMFTLASYDEAGRRYARDCVSGMLDMLERDLVSHYYLKFTVTE